MSLFELSSTASWQPASDATACYGPQHQRVAPSTHTPSPPSSSAPSAHARQRQQQQQKKKKPQLLSPYLMSGAFADSYGSDAFAGSLDTSATPSTEETVHPVTGEGASAPPSAPSPSNLSCTQEGVTYERAASPAAADLDMYDFSCIHLPSQASAMGYSTMQSPLLSAFRLPVTCVTGSSSSSSGCESHAPEAAERVEGQSTVDGLSSTLDDSQPPDSPLCESPQLPTAVQAEQLAASTAEIPRTHTAPEPHTEAEAEMEDSFDSYGYMLTLVSRPASPALPSTAAATATFSQPHLPPAACPVGRCASHPLTHAGAAATPTPSALFEVLEPLPRGHRQPKPATLQSSIRTIDAAVPTVVSAALPQRRAFTSGAAAKVAQVSALRSSALTMSSPQVHHVLRSQHSVEGTCSLSAPRLRRAVSDVSTTTVVLARMPTCVKEATLSEPPLAHRAVARLASRASLRSDSLVMPRTVSVPFRGEKHEAEEEVVVIGHRSDDHHHHHHHLQQQGGRGVPTLLDGGTRTCAAAPVPQTTGDRAATPDCVSDKGSAAAALRELVGMCEGEYDLLTASLAEVLLATPATAASPTAHPNKGMEAAAQKAESAGPGVAADALPFPTSAAAPAAVASVSSPAQPHDSHKMRLVERVAAAVDGPHGLDSAEFTLSSNPDDAESLLHCHMIVRTPAPPLPLKLKPQSSPSAPPFKRYPSFITPVSEPTRHEQAPMLPVPLPPAIAAPPTSDTAPVPSKKFIQRAKHARGQLWMECAKPRTIAAEGMGGAGSRIVPNAPHVAAPVPCKRSSPLIAPVTAGLTPPSPLSENNIEEEERKEAAAGERLAQLPQLTRGRHKLGGKRFLLEADTQSGNSRNAPSAPALPRRERKSKRRDAAAQARRDGLPAKQTWSPVHILPPLNELQVAALPGDDDSPVLQTPRNDSNYEPSQLSPEWRDVPVPVLRRSLIAQLAPELVQNDNSDVASMLTVGPRHRGKRH